MDFCKTASVEREQSGNAAWQSVREYDCLCIKARLMRLICLDVNSEEAADFKLTLDSKCIFLCLLSSERCKCFFSPSSHITAISYLVWLPNAVLVASGMAPFQFYLDNYLNTVIFTRIYSTLWDLLTRYWPWISKSCQIIFLCIPFSYY